MEDHNEPLKRLYVIHPAARGLSDEGHCRLLTGDVLPRSYCGSSGIIELPHLELQ